MTEPTNRASKTRDAATSIGTDALLNTELGEHIASLISVPEHVLKILKWTAITLLLVWAAIPLLFWGRVNILWFLPLYLYGTFVAVVLGGLLGGTMAIRGAIDNVVAIMRHGIELIDQSIEQLQAVRAGEADIPSARECILMAYEGVLLSTIRSIVVKQNRFIGPLIYRLYAFTIHRVVMRLLDEAEAESASQDEAVTNE